jgi:hypothetical protein
VVDCVESVIVGWWQWNAVTANKSPLWNATVRKLRLNHLDTVILQIEIDETFPHTILFLSQFMDSLLKVGIEP